jgi:hypothetical protein
VRLASSAEPPGAGYAFHIVSNPLSSRAMSRSYQK